MNEYPENGHRPEQDGDPVCDPLTGLRLHSDFQLFLTETLAGCKAGNSPCTIALLDVDWFSLFNEKMGFKNGDRALKHISDIVVSHIRRGDMAVRFAEDRFALLFANAMPGNACGAADRIRKAVEQDFDGMLTISAGLSSCPKDGITPESLIEKAKEALNVAKLEGKNKIVTFDGNPAADSVARPCVMIVDDIALNRKMIEGMLAPLNYRIIKAADGKEALHYAERHDIDLVLLDIMMPEMDGYEVCRRLKSRSATRMTPVIFVTALNDTDAKIEGIKAGADDFITKPPNKTELVTRTKSLVKLKSLYNDFTNIESVLFSLAKAVEAKNPYTKGHISRVAGLAVALGKRMNLGPEKIEALRFGGLLHDIGKIGIPNPILNKPGPLDDDEWDQLRSHPETGYRICYPLKDRLRHAMQVIRHHHEKLDGSGYPDGISGDAIPMVARITAVADIYDALITDRPYRKALSNVKALKILQQEALDGKLDRKVVGELVDSMKVQTSSENERFYPIITEPGDNPHVSSFGSA